MRFHDYADRYNILSRHSILRRLALSFTSPFILLSFIQRRVRSSFIYLFSHQQYLWRTFYMPGTLLSVREYWNKFKKRPCFQGSYAVVEMVGHALKNLQYYLSGKGKGNMYWSSKCIHVWAHIILTAILSQEYYYHSFLLHKKWRNLLKVMGL